MAPCGDDCCTGDPWKAALHASTHAFLKAAVKPKASVPALEVGKLDPKRFIIAFCGSGTGHMTQALAVVKLQQRAGLTLAGIVTDEDASPAILEEIIAPLNVPILILPSIKLVDGVKGMVPLPAVMVNIIQVQGQLQALHGKITAFLADARPGLLLSFWHITFAFFLQNFARPPPEMKVVHTAAQFALVQELDLAELRVPLEVVTMATASVMTGIFCSTGQTAPISPSPSPRALPPILEVPPALQPGSPRLVLCYFLVQSDALQLERLLAKEHLPGPPSGDDTYSFGRVEFHCFTSEPLPAPKGRPLALHSHRKQRKRFQELFARCTGVIVSSGNETVWESVCRGVPVLTMPTTGHGEQLLNARVHARNFPNLVRAAPPKGFFNPGGKLLLDDVKWLVSFRANEGAQRESAELRAAVSGLQDTIGSNELLSAPVPGRTYAPPK
jgi:hypothetical protein